jgi:hypothetical protein
MGAGNVKAVFVHWAELPGAPFRLLVYMALRTKDGDDHPRFWGGREDLAFGLGRRTADEKAFKAVKLAIAALLRVDAIRTVERARPGRNAVYEINLSPVRGTETGPHSPVDNSDESCGDPVEDAPMGPADRAPNGSRKPGGMGPGFRAEWVPENGGMGPADRAPKEEKDESGLNEGGEGEGFPASSPPCTSQAAKTWTYRAACEFLMTRPGDQRDEAERLAVAELGPAAAREQVLIRAAHHAHRIATGVPA